VGECIALIRGINVGRGKRVSMTDLRRLVTDLGHTNVRTLLNSGNVLFQTKRPNTVKLSSSIEAAIRGQVRILGKGNGHHRSRAGIRH